MQIVLKDEPDIDSNDQNSIIEHLDKVVHKICPNSFKIFSSFSHFLLLLLVSLCYSASTRVYELHSSHSLSGSKFDWEI